MTVKERILERLGEARKYHMDAAGRISPYGHESALRDKHIELAVAFRRAIKIVEAEFAKEGEDEKAYGVSVLLFFKA